MVTIKKGESAVRGLRGDLRGLDPEPDLDHANVGKYRASAAEIPPWDVCGFFYALGNSA